MEQDNGCLCCSKCFGSAVSMCEGSISPKGDKGEEREREGERDGPHGVKAKNR